MNLAPRHSGQSPLLAIFRLIFITTDLLPHMEAPLTFRALHPTFGAECSGVDFSQPVPKQTIGEIRAAMARYGVLVFRRTRLDDAGHVAFARQFGQLDTSTVITMPWAKHRLAPHKELTDVGNIDNKGRVMPKSSLAFQGGRANGLFHVDCSFHARRAGYSILRAHQLPPKGTGGGTMFADTRTAYDDLEDAIKKDISGYVLCHSSMHSKKIAAPDYIPFGIIKADEFSMIRRKLVQLHEPSGRINLYMAAHAHHIDGWTEKESQPVIQRLLQHASQDQYTFTVDWEDAGDLVIWVGKRNTRPELLLFRLTHLGQHVRHAQGLWRIFPGSAYSRYEKGDRLRRLLERLGIRR